MCVKGNEKEDWDALKLQQATYNFKKTDLIHVWLRHKTRWRCEVLPFPGLDAQPLIITILVGSETDAGNFRERLQSTKDDGLLTGGWQDKYGRLRIFLPPF